MDGQVFQTIRSSQLDRYPGQLGAGQIITRGAGLWAAKRTAFDDEVATFKEALWGAPSLFQPRLYDHPLRLHQRRSALERSQARARGSQSTRRSGTTENGAATWGSLGSKGMPAPRAINGRALSREALPRRRMLGTGTPRTHQAEDIPHG
jgi:hypothetical protein